MIKAIINYEYIMNIIIIIIFYFFVVFFVFSTFFDDNSYIKELLKKFAA